MQPPYLFFFFFTSCKNIPISLCEGPHCENFRFGAVLCSFAVHLYCSLPKSFLWRPPRRFSQLVMLLYSGVNTQKFNVCYYWYDSCTYWQNCTSHLVSTGLQLPDNNCIRWRSSNPSDCITCDKTVRMTTWKPKLTVKFSLFILSEFKGYFFKWSNSFFFPFFFWVTKKGEKFLISLAYFLVEKERLSYFQKKTAFYYLMGLMC